MLLYLLTDGTVEINLSVSEEFVAISIVFVTNSAFW